MQFTRLVPINDFGFFSDELRSEIKSTNRTIKSLETKREKLQTDVEKLNAGEVANFDPAAADDIRCRSVELLQTELVVREKMSATLERCQEEYLPARDATANERLKVEKEIEKGLQDLGYREVKSDDTILHGRYQRTWITSHSRVRELQNLERELSGRHNDRSHIHANDTSVRKVHDELAELRRQSMAVLS
jgi:hypothetical protein